MHARSGRGVVELTMLMASPFVNDMAGNRSDCPHGCLLRGEVNIGLKTLLADQRLVEGTSFMPEAGGVCDPLQAGRQTELQACDAVRDTQFPRQRRELHCVGMVLCTAVCMESIVMYGDDDRNVPDVVQSDG